MKLGERVEIISYIRWTLRGLQEAGLIGMTGKVTDEFDYGGRHFFTVYADNDGPYINGENGKKVKSWRIGNHCYFLEKELKPIT